MQCVTGGGGRHRYYRHPGHGVSIPNKARVRTADGELALDVRGDGGFVVAPGSVHSNGNVYHEPAPWPTDVSTLPVFDPSWLGEAFVTRQPTDAARPPGSAIPNGQRNATLASLAGGMRRRGMTQAEMVAALRVTNTRRCNPPLPDDEVEAIVTSVVRYEPAATGPPVMRPRQRLTLLDDAELMLRPDPSYLVAGHVVQRTLVTAYGPPEVYKSFLFTIDMALSVATGTPWLGSSIVTPGPVVAVVAEGADAIKFRVKAWKVSRGLPLDQSVGLHLLPHALNLSEPDEVQELIEVAGPMNPRLIIIDTLPRCLGAFEENSNSEMGRAIEAMDRIRADTGAVVMPITHSDKQAKDIRGASALRGASDTVLRVTREDDVCIIGCDKQKDAAAFPDIHVKIVPVPGTDSVVPRLMSELLPASQLTLAQFKVWNTLFELVGPKGATSTELEKLCPDVNPRTLNRVLNRLSELGAAYQEQAGKRYFGKPIAPHLWPEAT